ncbi:hypothetical protein DFH11DRAFT_1076473 [Phellopilus nigrolimitatus]|nr:hypothetical protein DFH11DRAFT_1076473 [Phellopilus nigrolimitatus]
MASPVQLLDTLSAYLVFTGGESQQTKGMMLLLTHDHYKRGGYSYKYVPRKRGTEAVVEDIIVELLHIDPNIQLHSAVRLNVEMLTGKQIAAINEGMRTMPFKNSLLILWLERTIGFSCGIPLTRGQAVSVYRWGNTAPPLSVLELSEVLLVEEST